MIIPDYREFKRSNELYHYGMPRRSGRYPWGSGKRPYQGDKTTGIYELKKYQTKFGYKSRQIAKTIANQAVASIPIIGDIILVERIRKRNSIILDRTDYVKEDGPIEELSQLKLKPSNSTPVEDDIKKCNPGYGRPGTVVNCTNCVAAMEMRRRGYDVQARRASDGKPTGIFEEIFKGAEIKWPTYDKKENETKKDRAQRIYNLLMNDLESQGNGARGVIRVAFEKFTNTNMGHVMYYEVNDGKVNIYDCQKGTPSTVDYALSIADPDEYAYARLDNLPLSDKVTELVISAKGGK